MDIKEFDQVCLRYNVSLSTEELKKIQVLYSPEDDEMINYKWLSYHLGLHKDSFNHMNSVALNSSRVSKSVYKLKQSLNANKP